ncbi:MAG: hypothetical protein PHQ19_02110 [Candidatus Krumholzibacteria bacterium]|nr:hypothetical protein [Candidatus Krumholzibacteria bacterium]
MSHRFRYGAWFIACLLVFGAAVWLPGCSNDSSPTSAEQTSMTANLTNDDDGVPLKADDPRVLSVMAIQDRHTPALMADPDVIGTATTAGDDGKPAIMVLVLSDRAGRGVPKQIEGVGVKVVLTDKIVAMGKPPSSSVSHTAKQTPPIQLGTSGGWRYDLANGYCCGGTLGSLIQVGSQKRILSNYHVFEADIVLGDNNKAAATGDYIIQPGLIDVSCNAANAQNVATLVKTSSLPNNNVDCSSATIITGMVREDGAILEVGTLSASTVAAYVNQPVKKSGRTTGLTRSTVSGLNATISVAYENECAGGSAFTKTFTGQILIANKRSKFLAGGDSGSLMVEDLSTNPRAVGLLFAGSTTIAVANPIGQVLSFLGASMVGY